MTQNHANYRKTEPMFNIMRSALDDYENQTAMNMGEFATSRGINAHTFRRVRREGFPNTWEECQGTAKGGSGTIAHKKKREAFIVDNLHSDLGVPLKKKYKATFPEVTDKQSRANRLRAIRKEIRKRLAAENQLAAAASSVTADEDSDSEPEEDFS